MNMEANLGPAVLGAERAALVHHDAATGADNLGSLVTGPIRPAAAEADVAETEAIEGGQFAVREIGPILANNPEWLAGLVELEEARPLPRVTAIAAFRVAVTAETDAALVARIDALAAKLS